MCRYATQLGRSRFGVLRDAADFFVLFNGGQRNGQRRYFTYRLVWVCGSASMAMVIWEGVKHGFVMRSMFAELAVRAARYDPCLLKPASLRLAPTFSPHPWPAPPAAQPAARQPAVQRDGCSLHGRHDEQACHARWGR